MGGEGPNKFEMNLPHLLVPFENSKQEKRLDIWIQLLSNTHSENLDVTISDCCTQVFLKQKWTNSIVLLNTKKVLKPFKTKSDIPTYGEEHAYTMAYTNSVKKTKGNTCDSTLFSKVRFFYPSR